MIRPLYKAQEPFMEAPASHGYMGVIMYDDTEDKVQCHICGKWFKHLSSHVHVTHDISGDAYKDRFGLARKIALCGVSVSRNRRVIIEKAIKRGVINALRNTKAFYRRRTYRNGQAAMSFKNRNGLCDLQMHSRYLVVKEIVGHEPLGPDLKKHDSRLYGAIGNKFGGLNKYKKKIGVAINAIGRKAMEDIELVAHLRRWASENSSRPRPTDFMVAKNGYPGRTVFQKHFGSWSNALRTAGIK